MRSILLLLGYSLLLPSSTAIFFGCCPTTGSLTLFCMPCNHLGAAAVPPPPPLPPPPTILPPPPSIFVASPPFDAAGPVHQIGPMLGSVLHSYTGQQQQQFPYALQSSYGSQVQLQVAEQPYAPQQQAPYVPPTPQREVPPIVQQQVSPAQLPNSAPPYKEQQSSFVQQQQQRQQPSGLVRKQPNQNKSDFGKRVVGEADQASLPIVMTSVQKASGDISDKDVADALNAIDDIGNGTLEAHKPADPVPISSLIITKDPQCNNDDLRAILQESMGENLNMAKRLIQLAAEAQFGGQFDVICSRNDFSYLTNTELFCQVSKDNLSCYAYRQL